MPESRAGHPRGAGRHAPSFFIGRARGRNGSTKFQYFGHIAEVWESREGRKAPTRREGREGERRSRGRFFRGGLRSRREGILLLLLVLPLPRLLLPPSTSAEGFHIDKSSPENLELVEDAALSCGKVPTKPSRDLVYFIRERYSSSKASSRRDNGGARNVKFPKSTEFIFLPRCELKMPRQGNIGRNI